jgi:PD-(D/E)XK nuclease superfamily
MNMLYLSQAHLETFAKCPPTFQQKYLDQLATPIAPDQQEKMDWGVNFHLAMQQLQLGFPLEAVTQNPDLQRAIAQLLEQLPQFLQRQTDEFAEAEYRQTFKIDDVLLTIICDWILFTKKSVAIYDWKTYRQPKNPQFLKDHWQTKLYLYLIAETTQYQPKQISMTYWFITAGEVPQSLTFKYNQTWHKAIKQELQLLVEALQDHLSAYFEEEIPFQHPENTTCSICEKKTNKGRSPEIFEQLENLDQFLADIPAIEV